MIEHNADFMYVRCAIGVSALSAECFDVTMCRGGTGTIAHTGSRSFQSDAPPTRPEEKPSHLILTQEIHSLVC